MPHHSAQQRQMNAFPGGHNPTMVGGNPPGGFPPRSIVPPRGMDFRMMPGMHMQHHAIRGHPHMGMGSWMPSHQQMAATNQEALRHGDVHGEESSSTGTPALRPEETTPTRNLSHDDSKSFDSPHEVAASVLLLAASAVKDREENHQQQTVKEANSSDDSSAPVPSSMPLKKRKKVADIIRKKPDEPNACHVSPSSQSSKNTGATEETCVAETATPTSASDRGASHSSPTSSYDLKDGQALPDSAKINNTKDIAPPAHVEIPHFPSVLHAVLTESEFAGKVLQWLPHGQAWRVVRWDALRRQVLPKYFPQLREEDSKESSGSIDSFLWHLSAWGMEEVTDGPDAGAYSHVLFRRELPRLCLDMRFSPSREKQKEENVVTHQRSGSEGARSILQVPSLASTATIHTADTSGRRMEEEKKEDPLSEAAKNAPPAQVTPGWHPRQVVGGAFSVGYRPENAAAASAEAWKFYSSSTPQWFGTPASQQQQQHQQFSTTIPPYSPIRVRSGRGARRALSLNRATHQKDPLSPSKPFANLTVSNRGRGGKVGLRPRVTLQSESAADTSTTADDADSTTAATATAATTTTTTTTSTTKAKKTPAPRPILKRKLPMATRNQQESEPKDGGRATAATTTTTTTTPGEGVAARQEEEEESADTASTATAAAIMDIQKDSKKEEETSKQQPDNKAMSISSKEDSPTN